MTILYHMTKLFMTVYARTVCYSNITIKLIAQVFFFVSQGIDDLLSKHISHLFIRDPLVIFSETINQDDSSSSDHFEVLLFALAVKIGKSFCVTCV